MTHATLDALRAAFDAHGHQRYTGEPVSHLEHALQAAAFAERARAGDALIVAALLHDIGHLVSGLAGTPSVDGVDDAHEWLGAALLAPLFPPEVVEPVALHVQAKRYLVVRPAYRRSLSQDSLRSLVLQGGPMTAAERCRFEALPFARAALRLRRWDEASKRPGAQTPSLDEVWRRVERVARVPAQTPG